MQAILGRRIAVVDNADWLLKVKLIDFLRDIGKHFTVNELVKRDIIRRRLETPTRAFPILNSRTRSSKGTTSSC